MDKKAAFLLLLLTSNLALCIIATQPAGAIEDSTRVQWTRSFGSKGAMGYSVYPTADGGYAIAGSNASKGYSSSQGYLGYVPMIIKTNSAGEVEWEKTYETYTGSGTAYAIAQTADLGYALFHGTGILKTDVKGNVEWNKTYAANIAAGILTSQGDYVALANENDGHGTINSKILKIDRQGNALWNITFNAQTSAGTLGVVAHSVMETEDNGYALTGSWEKTGWLAKTSSGGNVLLNRTLEFDSGPFANQGFSIVQTGDGGYMVAVNSLNVPWFVKTDSQGNVEFTRLFALNGFLGSIVQTEDNGFFAVGSQNENAWIVRIDASGSSLWEAAYGDPAESLNENTMQAVVKTVDGGYAAVGSVNDAVWLVKLAAEPIISQTPTPLLPSPSASSSSTVAPTATTDQTDAVPEIVIRILIMVVIAAAIGIILMLRNRRRSKRPI
jgi:hypothetical protein